MTLEDRIAHAKLQFRLFRLPNSRVDRIRREINILRKVGEGSRKLWEQKGMRGPRIPQKYLAIIGPSGSGKSTCIKTYVEEMLEDEALDDEVKPVAHVTLSAEANTKSLGSDILEEYDDAEFNVGIARTLLKRASNAMEMARTDVMVLDEFHHLIRNDKGTDRSWTVTETVKRMLIRGACPLVLVGIETAKPLPVNNPQIAQRAYTPLFIKPLDAKYAADRQEFLDHCHGFDLKLVEHGIFEERSGLLANGIPANMFDVSGGVIGTASNTFEAAAVFALERGARRIEWEDLVEAVDAWAIEMGMTDHNPFRHGPRALRDREKTK
ncbi:ATP-binding protein [Methylobacterium sp. B4]|uniref:ATP-binding protein n=1 Tax=Methylobacterium sp. B4 TaxID=1938755 RepID=UPI000D752E70|nr:ATP-binding protein [Methylobacterium sp. B4]PXW62969.1 TniB protein [Methylobacterium sp. B4]